MQFHFHANQSHFHKNGFALRLALKQRHKGTRKWSISQSPFSGKTCNRTLRTWNICFKTVKKRWSYNKRTISTWNICFKVLNTHWTQFDSNVLTAVWYFWVEPPAMKISWICAMVIFVSLKLLWFLPIAHCTKCKTWINMQWRYMINSQQSKTYRFKDE